MNRGEIITIHFLAEVAKARVLESERYHKAIIVGCEMVTNTTKIAVATVFPDYPYLPPFSPEPYFYSPPSAWIEWQNHLWVAPVGLPSGTGRRIEHADLNPIAFAKRRIDYIHELVAWYGMTKDLIMVPGTDKEWEIHKKWWPKF